MHTLETLARRVHALEAVLGKICPALEKMADGVSDVEIRNLFVMSKIMVPVRRSSSLIYDGKPKVEQLTLLALFDEQKDAFIEMVMASKEPKEPEGLEDGQDASAVEATSERIANAAVEGASADANANVAALRGNIAGALDGLDPRADAFDTVHASRAFDTVAPDGQVP